MQWAERAAALATAAGHEGRGHRRYAYGSLVWCDLCGAYADRFAVGLARPCPGRPLYASRAAQLRRLQRGRHPLTGHPFRDAAIAEHYCGDGSTVSYPLGGTMGGVFARWGSVDDLVSIPRQPPARSRTRSAAGDRHVDPMLPAAERRRPTDSRNQASPADRLAALRRRLQSKWDGEQRVTAREPDPSPLPSLPVGNAVGRADDRGVVKVPQHRDDVEASRQSVLPPAHADGHEEDDARGSKRRRLLTALAASGQGSSSGALPPYLTVTRNVTRTAARHGTMMRQSNGGDVITNDDEPADAQRRSKKQRII